MNAGSVLFESQSAELGIQAKMTSHVILTSDDINIVSKVSPCSVVLKLPLHKAQLPVLSAVLPIACGGATAFSSDT